MNILK